MSLYEISINAENDLREIAQYTLNKWGNKIFEQYRRGLIKTFDAIANKEVLEKRVSKNLSDVFVSKYRHHFIFYLKTSDHKPIIIAVIHEQRDILNHLIERLQ